MNRTLAFYALLFKKDFSLFCNLKLQELGVTQGLIYFIIYIGNHSGCFTGDLISALHMDWGHAQRSVNKLVEDGLVKKEKNAKDKRAYHLYLTPKGEEVFSLSHQVFSDWDSLTLQCLSAEEKQQLFNILEKLAHSKGDDECVREHSKPY